VRAIAPVALTTSPVPTWYAAWVAFPTSFTNQVWYGARRPAVGRGSLVATKMSAMTPNAFTPSDRKFLAGIVHQVWRACQVYVTVAMERSPGHARPALDELAKWAVARRRELGSHNDTSRPLSPSAQQAGRALLDDVETISRQVIDMITSLQASPLPPDQVEEQTLGIIEGVLRWTSLMASQLGITGNLRPHTLWFER